MHDAAEPVVEAGGRPFGLRLIVGYKLGKALLQGLLALALFSAVGDAFVDRLLDFGQQLLAHATHAWSIALAKWIVAATGQTYRHVIEAALAGDALLSAAEGWALLRRYTWAPWLVVLTTGSLLPFEVVALVRSFSIGRVVLLVLNAAIVAYLLRTRLARGRPAGKH